MASTARLSLSPGETVAPAVVRAARARGSHRIRFRATSGFLDRAVLGFEDLRASMYRSVEASSLTVVCLDGEIDISGTEPSARIAAVVDDVEGRRLSGRLLEGRVGQALELRLVDSDASGATVNGSRRPVSAPPNSSDLHARPR